jgi:F-box-like
VRSLLGLFLVPVPCLHCTSRENRGRLAFSKSLIGKLPAELLVEIFSLLRPSDLLAVSEVCKDFLVLSSDDRIWRRKIHALFGDSPPSTVRSFASQKELYIAIGTQVAFVCCFLHPLSLSLSLSLSALILGAVAFVFDLSVRLISEHLASINSQGCVRWPRHLHGKVVNIHRSCIIEGVYLLLVMCVGVGVCVVD